MKRVEYVLANATGLIGGLGGGIIMGSFLFPHKLAIVVGAILAVVALLLFLTEFPPKKKVG